MVVPPLSDVVIIGAGLGGVALAIALHQQSIPVRIYESRALDASEVASGVILTPNGLLVLDKLGVLTRITSRCWLSEFRTYKNDKDETTKKVLITNESLYGYKNHRVWRKLLLDEMKAMLQERGISVQYRAKFEGIVEESSDGVTFRINGQAEKGSLLIGSDGIWSSVRKYLDTTVVPEYTGITGLLAHIKRDVVRWPYADYEKACTIQGKPGAFFMMPEDPQGHEIMVGMQVRYPAQKRDGWEALAADKEQCCNFFRKGYDEWHDTAKQIIDAVCDEKDSLYLWPFLKMPKLVRWYSETGRVILTGDAAHALPPSSGQGINQALEDLYTLSMLLRSDKDLLECLSYWQEMRQARIDSVYDWSTNATNVQRLPEEERNRLIGEGKVKDIKGDFEDMRWLYQPDLEAQVKGWLTEA